MPTAVLLYAYMHSLHRSAVRAGAALLAIAGLAMNAAPALAAATTVNADAAVNAPAPAKEYPLDAAIDAAVNGPLGEAAAAAKVTAENPELQGAVKSVWALAFEAFWNFFKKMAAGFLGLFTGSVTVDVNADAAVNSPSNEHTL